MRDALGVVSMLPEVDPGVVSIDGVVAGVAAELAPASVVLSVSVVVVSVFFWHPVRSTDPTKAAAAKATSLFLMSFLLPFCRGGAG